MLAGIAAGIGTAVDAVILCSEKLRKCKNYSAAEKSLSQIAGPLLAGTATTVAALLPLSAVDNAGARIIASAIAVVSITALVLSFSLLPPLLLWGLDSRKATHSTVRADFSALRKLFEGAYARLSRLMCRILAVNVRFCARYPVMVLAICVIITATAIFALFAKGVDTSSYGSEDSVYAQVEFDGGLLTEETDRLLASYSEKLASNAGIKNVETGARTGSGSLLISFNPEQIQTHQVKT